MVALYKLIAAVMTVAAIGTTASCQSTTPGGVAGAEPQQLLLVSSDELNRMAVQAYSKLQAESAKKGVLNADPHTDPPRARHRQPHHTADPRLSCRRADKHHFPEIRWQMGQCR